MTQNGGVYTLDGFDDQCGAPQRAPLVGLATPNPDGTIGFGLNIVTVPGGKSVHVDARMSLATFGGPWSDSAGNSGTLVFNGAAAGSARPVPTGAPAWGTLIQAPAGPAGQGLTVVRATADAFTPPAIAVQFGPPSSISVLGGAGVFASSQSGPAIFGLSDSSLAVGGLTLTGVGLAGSTVGTGTGVRATGNGALGTALDVSDGALRVSRSTRTAFQHTAIVANISGHATTIDHPLINGDQNAMLFITHVYNAGATVYEPNPTSVWYDPSISRWRLITTTSSRWP